MKTVTLSEYAKKIHTQEKMIREDPKATAQIETFAESFCKHLNDTFEKGKDVKIKILTDYDCDGITSAFIMNRMLEAIDSSIEVEVICNDRRGSYGVPRNVRKEADTTYVILDMGSNELEYIEETFGLENVFMADHHLVTDEENRRKIISMPNLLNPHAIHKDDKENAQYCAAGLAYRVYQICSEHVNGFNHDYKRDNTVAIMAGIGTIGDVVNIMDMNSYNRAIAKDCIKRINEATEDNLETPIGYILIKTGIDDNRTFTKQLAFGIVSFINAASRMSEYIEQNGAQLMYDTIVGDPRKPDTYFHIDDLAEINKEKKNLCNELQNNTYYNFIASEMHTARSCLVYPLNPDLEDALYNEIHGSKVLHSMAGIVAGRISESTDKASICLVYHKEGDYWSGSGRNAEGNSSLKDYIDAVMMSDEGKDLNMKYGGHHDAIGISRLEGFDSLHKLIRALDAHKDLLKKKDNYEKVYLRMPASELSNPDTLETLLELQPVGTGNNIPPVIVSGRLRNETKDGIISKNPRWMRRVVDADDGKYYVKDWSYNPSNYVTNDIGKNKFVQGETTFVATMDINCFRGNMSIDLTKKTDMAYYKEYSLPLAQKGADLKRTTQKSKTDREM